MAWYSRDIEERARQKYEELVAARGSTPLICGPELLRERLNGLVGLVDAIGLVSLNFSDSHYGLLGSKEMFCWQVAIEEDALAILSKHRDGEGNAAKSEGGTPLSAGYYRELLGLPDTLKDDACFLSFRAGEYLLSKEGQREMVEVMLPNQEVFSKILYLFGKFAEELAHYDKAAVSYPPFSKFCRLPEAGRSVRSNPVRG